MREVIIIHNEIEHSYVFNIHKLQIFEFGLKPWAIFQWVVAFHFVNFP